MGQLLGRQPCSRLYHQCSWGALLPPAPPPANLPASLCQVTKSPVSAPPHQCLASLLLPVPCMQRTSSCWDVSVCSLGVISWMRTLTPLSAANGASLRLRSCLCQLCMYYARGCAFVAMHLWWYNRRQTPSQLLTPSQTLGEMQSAENRMGHDKHDLEKHSLAKTLVGKPGLPWQGSRGIEGVEVVAD